MEGAETNRRGTKQIVAVLPRNYPKCQIKPQDLAQYQEAIRKTIRNAVEKRIDSPPEFHNHEIKNGGLIVTCVSGYDEWWLRRHIDEVRFKYELKVDSPSALENRFLIDGEVTNLENTAQNILQKIRRFNTDVTLTGWKIINEEMNYEKMRRIITFEMPDASVKLLRQLKLRLRLDEYGVDGINFSSIRRSRIMNAESPHGWSDPLGSSQQQTMLSNTSSDNAEPSTSAKSDIIDEDSPEIFKQLFREELVNNTDEQKMEILKSVLYDNFCH